MGRYRELSSPVIEFLSNSSVRVIPSHHRNKKVFLRQKRVTLPCHGIQWNNIAGKDNSAHIATAICAELSFRSEEHTSELQSRPHISYAVFCLKKKKKNKEQSPVSYHPS